MVSTGVETVRLCLGSSVVQYNDMHNVLIYVLCARYTYIDLRNDCLICALIIVIISQVFVVHVHS